ncbi:hypothetical protein D3C81_1243720 [compost metagenome]
MDKRAEDYPLDGAREQRTAQQHGIDTAFDCRAGRVIAKLQRHRPKQQRQEHHNERQVQRRQQDRIGPGEQCEKSAAPEYEPGLVGIPDRQDAHRHGPPVFGIARKSQQHADAQIGSVEQHVVQHRERQGTRRKQCQSVNVAHGSVSSAMACLIRQRRLWPGFIFVWRAAQDPQQHPKADAEYHQVKHQDQGRRDEHVLT